MDELQDRWNEMYNFVVTDGPWIGIDKDIEHSYLNGYFDGILGDTPYCGSKDAGWIEEFYDMGFHDGIGDRQIDDGKT